ncbi:hypothetical protein DF021_34965 [Burkholderia stagnalis]|uniref:Uncharacterized protein n=1 Tax=Burkholderia stagnalis TaxID=1503054 RepID=A0ABX9YE90_9BURK|nr:hypothetical protein DF158_33605 [Burkholderia stagnalis]RQQ59322.1 hypothetical protein DF137_33835 [Burkholderia stagnalis]RQQ59800.1 hypothetical protein DF139_33715 [Burkholderia stagnalis]RQQ74143.1 hypothetical protein DF138_33220 [Burkholderia stagnalis]RQQ79879.1 hypothetical protein DF134_33910 [Burkholderia stagnalis]
MLGRVLDVDVYVADASAGTLGLGAVFAVNTISGTRVLISDFGDPAQGPVDANLFSGPMSIVIAPQGCPLAGTIYVLNAGAGPLRKGLLMKINPLTGYRTIVSDFGNGDQGPTAAGLQLGAVVWEIVGGISLNKLIVQDGGAGNQHLGALFEVEPETGKRLLLSDFGNASSGDVGSEPAGAAIVP